MSTPSFNSAVPIPVPTVTMITTPRRPRNTEACFRHPRRVGVVQDGAVPARRATDHRGRVGADPRLVDVRGGANGSPDHDGRQRAADRTRVAELLHERCGNGGDGFGSRGLRCLDPDPAGRGAGREVDVRGLDTRAAHVDTDE